VSAERGDEAGAEFEADGGRLDRVVADRLGLTRADVQRAIDRYLSSGSICYDIGASIGYMSLLMARSAEHVYAFEPAPHAAEELRGHARCNGFDNITLVPAAVSDSGRPVVFSVTDNAYGSRIRAGSRRWQPRCGAGHPPWRRDTSGSAGRSSGSS